MSLNKTERKATLWLATVFGSRMLGLFMLLPVFSIYGKNLAGYSELWIGLAIGAYGLSQALFQVPMGIASDRFGRKPVIYFGLLLFALGSVVAACSHSIYGVTAGRLIQGAGAISSAVMALAADLSRDEERPKVMAMIGMFIGMSFIVAVIVGPLLAEELGLSGLFWFIAAMAIVGLLIIRLCVPNAVNRAPQRDSIPQLVQIKEVIRNPQLWRLDAAVFVIHLSMTALFVVLPTSLVATGIAKNHLWLVLFPAFVISFFGIIPLMICFTHKKRVKRGLQVAVAMMAVGLFCYPWLHSKIGLLALVAIFFCGFNYLEASLPSLLARLAPAGQKGSAMGVFASSQFFGAFCGGALGGAISQHYSATVLLMVVAVILIIWGIISTGLVERSPWKNVSIPLPAGADEQALADRMVAVQGVEEVIIVAEEHTIYLKYDEQQCDIKTLRAMLVA